MNPHNSSTYQTHDSHESTTSSEPMSFRHKVITVVIITTIAALIIALFISTLSIIPLIFITLLIAILLRSLANPLAKHTPLSGRWAVVLVALTLLISISLFFIVTGPIIVEQFDQLVTRIPEALTGIEEQLRQYDWGVTLLGRLEEVPSIVGNFDFYSRLTGFFSSIMGILTNFALILVAGIYMAFEPDLYINGFTRLFPINRRDRVYDVLNQSYRTIRQWLLARFLAMFVVGILTLIGLTIIGMPLAPTLAIIAGFLSFIPNLGSLLSLIPAVLVGMTQSLWLSVAAIVVYIVVQQIENYLVTPNIQRQTVSLPPALVLLSQILLVLLFGWLGLFIAAPLVAFSIVIIKAVYIEDFLGEKVEQSADDNPG